MGGSYRPSYSSAPSTPAWESDTKSNFESFIKTGELERLVMAYHEFTKKNSSGFIAHIAKLSKIQEVEDIPKEFVGIEYEVKFDIGLQPGSGKEPTLADYLASFDFPPSKTARFLKDPVSSLSEGINSFLGDESDEKLVVIEKEGKIYLKEKGPVVPLKTGVKHEEIVMKRTEERYESNIKEMLEKVSSAASDNGVKYAGRIRKEKADDYILDTSDGRIYSFTITRAHLIKPGETKESRTQRQLEIEYAGYIPGFKGFDKDDEKQLVQGMVDLAKYTAALYSAVPLKNKWRAELAITHERKYDFIQQNQVKDKKAQKDELALEDDGPEIFASIKGK